MNELDCPVARDLLPLYAEAMLSPESGAAVEAHLSACPACREKYEAMKAAVPAGPGENLEKAVPLKRYYLHLALIILGSPLWFPLLLTALALALTFCILLWTADAACWCVPLSLAACAAAGLAAGGAALALFPPANGVFLLGCAAACAGLAVLSAHLCLLLTRLLARFMKTLFRRMKNLAAGKKKGANTDD